MCELPAEYAAALRRASQRLDDFRAELDALDASAPLKQELHISPISPLYLPHISHVSPVYLASAPLKQELQRTLQANFKEWLQRSGNLRQLHDLVAISAQPDAPEGVSPSRRS